MTNHKEYLSLATEVLKFVRSRLPKQVVNTPVFVLGYTVMGKWCGFAAINPLIKGVILLGAEGEKMYDSALRQLQYLSSLDRDPPL